MTKRRGGNMQPELAEMVCPYGCCHSSFLGHHHHASESPKRTPKLKSTSAACRHDFAAVTASSIFPNAQFTNHESLPPLQQSFFEFAKVHPQYLETTRIDEIRDQEYSHLSRSNRTCLDYLGIGLFSYAQLKTQEFLNQQATTSSSPQSLQAPPFFGLAFKIGNLKTQLLHGGPESELESVMKKRIMSFLNVSENDYCMVFTANKTSAFKLVAESYPFQSSRKLLTVYDYESEAVETMINSSEKKGAEVMSAEFSWPRLRIQSAKLKKMVVRKNKNKNKKRGLFIFPLHSRLTGARYPYLWMNIAEENGWHVLIDACALGPKDMNSFGLSIYRPDFLICSVYKVFGENPSGFGCLFVKKSTISVLETSHCSGMVSLIPVEKLSGLGSESSGTDVLVEDNVKQKLQEESLASPSSFSGHLPVRPARLDEGETEIQVQQAEITEKLRAVPHVTETSETGKAIVCSKQGNSESTKGDNNNTSEIECRGLDQVDSLGLTTISNRSRCLINWLVNALMKLHHPNTEGVPLVMIYGPRIKFDRRPALAFNVFDWKGEKMEPVLVQKLADRNNISLSYGLLHHLCFADKVLEKRGREGKSVSGNRKADKTDSGISVVTAALGFLADFQDVYRLWSFIAQFLDADFVEKERWRYTALDQKLIELN